MAYKVSIIVPVYNAEKYLDMTIRSVINQDYGFNNIELLLIDDQSPDGSYEIAKQYADKYPNITAEKMSYPAGSASAPRNRGLQLATGQYVMFLDSDDCLAKKAVRELLSIFDAYDVDIADGAFEVIVGRSNKGKLNRYDAQREGIYDFVKDIDEWFPIAHPIFTKMFRMDVVRENNLTFEETLVNGEDSLFLFQYMSCTRCAYHINTVVHKYRRRDESLSHNYTLDYFKRFLHAYGIMQKNLIAEIEIQYLNKFLEFTLFPNLDILCDSQTIGTREKDIILRETVPFIQYMIDKCIDCNTTPLGQILTRDISRRDIPDYINDFHSVEEIYKQRAEMMNDVFSSRGWKMITAVNRLIGR